MALSEKGAKAIVMKGLGDEKGNIGLLVYENGAFQTYFHERIPTSFHGTGDVFASAFVALYLRKRDMLFACEKAADFTLACIKNTLGREDHLYGVCFEECLSSLARDL